MTANAERRQQNRMSSKTKHGKKKRAKERNIHFEARKAEYEARVSRGGG